MKYQILATAIGAYLIGCMHASILMEGESVLIKHRDAKDTQSLLLKPDGVIATPEAKEQDGKDQNNAGDGETQVEQEEKVPNQKASLEEACSPCMCIRLFTLVFLCVGVVTISYAYSNKDALDLFELAQKYMGISLLDVKERFTLDEQKKACLGKLLASVRVFLGMPEPSKEDKEEVFGKSMEAIVETINKIDWMEKLAPTNRPEFQVTSEEIQTIKQTLHLIEEKAKDLNMSADGKDLFEYFYTVPSLDAKQDGSLFCKHAEEDMLKNIFLISRESSASGTIKESQKDAVSPLISVFPRLVNYYKHLLDAKTEIVDMLIQDENFLRKMHTPKSVITLKRSLEIRSNLVQDLFGIAKVFKTVSEESELFLPAEKGDVADLMKRALVSVPIKDEEYNALLLKGPFPHKLRVSAPAKVESLFSSITEYYVHITKILEKSLSSIKPINPEE
ncbi:hypothetical protein NECID01_0693 [Nematocida sp. AWRm77]|nr:hypothetical protein NECID01_0693 [Nematocida sp. AWRm77]